MQCFFVSFSLLEILETFGAVSAVVVQFVGVFLFVGRQVSFIDGLETAVSVGAFPKFLIMCLDMRCQFGFSEVGSFAANYVTVVIWC